MLRSSTKLTLLFNLDGVDVYVHWSVFAVAAVFLIGSFQAPALTLMGMACWIGVMLIHEFGHVIAARRLRCGVFGIELYPILGIAKYDMPRSHFDRCVIAWGGVMAQAVVALPLVTWVAIFGYTRFPAVNAVFGILGFYSCFVALFNLLPIEPLDGSIAWGIVPALIRRKRPQRKQEVETTRFRRWG